MNRAVQAELIARLRRDADQICLRFGLRYRSIDPERANVKRRYGICYDDGSIKIRLRNVVTGEPLKYSSLVSTLCHELAHLKHFDHGPHFKAFNVRLLEWTRREGIYRPRAARPATEDTRGARTSMKTEDARRARTSMRTGDPVQLDLFASVTASGAAR